ncbi:hypothetical protein [Aeromonas caviae]|uniref:hypothetical protein n=1 Tax=Aeromonas caviae TaxID=648 RepID=UPI003F746B66
MNNPLNTLLLAVIAVSTTYTAYTTHVGAWSDTQMRYDLSRLVDEQDAQGEQLSSIADNTDRNAIDVSDILEILEGL